MIKVIAFLGVWAFVLAGNVWHFGVFDVIDLAAAALAPEEAPPPKTATVLQEVTLTKEERERIERDRQRIADLKRIQAALERYIADHGTPPPTASYNEANSWLKFDTSTEGAFLPFLMPNYLPRVPVDPLNLGQNPVERGYFYYYYQGDSDWAPQEAGKHFYILGTYLENGQSNAFLGHEVGYFLGRELSLNDQ